MVEKEEINPVNILQFSKDLTERSAVIPLRTPAIVKCFRTTGKGKILSESCIIRSVSSWIHG
ncbi:hypothetical protein HZS_4456, partial [Henneguya salminicola]